MFHFSYSCYYFKGRLIHKLPSFFEGLSDQNVPFVNPIQFFVEF